MVRLKGGDPYILGRGFEELLYLTERGIFVEVVPGVTSASSVAAYAGIPLTHRGRASSVALVAGHGTKGEYQIPYPDADTLVYLMCVTNLEEIVGAITRLKGSEDVPCALIERGTTIDEKVVVGCLRDIAQKGRKANLTPPAILIVGEVVKLRERISPKRLHGACRKEESWKGTLVAKEYGDHR